LLILLSVGSDHQVIGKVGRLTGEIVPGRMGEVMIPIRGGTEAYFAYAADPEEALPRGTRVVVIEHDPPRTVIVSRLV
jgi:membrane protein implicated in regulation of membrane protease activity